MQGSVEDHEKISCSRPALGRRATCQYYSPVLVLSSNDEKRLQVVLELLQTEEKYNCCLHTLKSVFEDKLHSTNIIPVKDIEAMFPSALKEIRHIHDQLCTTLRVRVQQWNYQSKVGDVFVHFFSNKNQLGLIGHYSSYSNNFPKAIRAISRCVRNSIDFETFLQKSSSGPSWKGLDLQAMLLNPIQRLPRYLLLLKQLMRFTDFNHPDRSHVEQALAAMSNTVTVLNNSIESSLKVACEYTTRKRFTRRRSPIQQRDALKVSIKTIDQLNVKPNSDEANAATGQSRPVSICSSVSSGYASGDEGDSSSATPSFSPCPCNGPNCNLNNTEFSRLVREMKHESALELVAKQKFDFSVSCISPALQKLHQLRRQNESTIQAATEEEENGSDSTLDKSEENENQTICDVKTTSKSNEEAVDQNMDNFIEDFSTTLSNFETLHMMKLLSSNQQDVAKPRSYSDELQLSHAQALSPQSEWDSFAAQADETPLTRQNSSHLKRFRRNRRSWAPRSPISSSSVLDGSLQDVVIEDDTISVLSDFSTTSGESTMSGVSAMSMPVDGKHATKRKYFKLKDFFRHLRSKERRSKSLLVNHSSMAAIPQEEVKLTCDVLSPRMMISSV